MSERVTNWDRVRESIEEAERAGGIAGVVLRGPAGARFEHRAERRFRAASTVKVPLTIECLRQAERGRFTLDDPHRLTRAEKTPGSGVLLELHDGIELTVRDLLYLTISISDNTATNILIDLAGMEAVNATMRDLGMTASTLERKMRGRPALPGEPENWATPADYATVIAALLDGQAAAAESCATAIELLTRQQNNRRIARHLPANEDYRWGSKTGSIAGVTNDAGFVTTPRGTLIASVFCENFADQHVAEAFIGDVCRAAFDACGLLEAVDPR